MIKTQFITLIFFLLSSRAWAVKASLISWHSLQDDKYLKIHLNFDKKIDYSFLKKEKANSHVYYVPHAINSKFGERQDLSHLLAISFWIKKYKSGLRFKFYPRGVKNLKTRLIHNRKTLEILFLSPYLSRTEIDPLGENFVVCIDAGHGGQDPGAHGSYSDEKDVVLKIARILKQEINSKPNLKAYLTRDSDYKILLEDRGKVNDYAGADVFISLHMNASVASARGFEIFYISKKGALDYKTKSLKVDVPEILATKKEKTQKILNEILDDLIQNETMNDSALFAQSLAFEMKKIKSRRNRGVRREAFVVLKNIETPSVLIELGFITNKSDEKYFNKKSSQREMSKKIATGVVNFLKKYKSLPKVSGNSFYEKLKRPIISRYPKFIIEYKNYTIKSGDTFLKIAKRFKISYSKLKRANPTIKPDRLYVGKILKIPNILKNK
ncbi:MAG: hypothetical protein COB02_08480 [Candidatus Cloacimonadota bacterium]|nr:MAG: hypothetical protein COB02_08480 [Candidatus Cloacimonadota bacterium]